MFDPAPYYQDVAAGDAPSDVSWTVAQDGVRIRIAIWRHPGARGTILMFPGRTEYVEKYADVAAAFAARGFALVAIDWRGQGLADRLIAPRSTGHVGRFSDYQLDVAALLELLGAHELPKARFLIGHSMGGAIGLQALLDGIEVRAACFTAPMWGIGMSPHMRPVAWALSWGAQQVGQSHRLTPGTVAETYVTAAPFEDNKLTADAACFSRLRDQVTAHPDLALGGPSLKWLYEAMIACRQVRQAPAPDLPVVTFLAEKERIVDIPSIHARMQSWPTGRLEIVEGAEHEVLMETPPRRAQVVDGAAALFEAQL